MKLKVVELFAGIGSQHQALDNIGADFEIVATSEWSVNSLISYDLVHHQKRECVLSKDQIIEELKKFTFSLDHKKPINISKLSEKTLRMLYVANWNNKNMGSIIDIKGRDFPDHDLLTYSFPCQDLSIMGKKKGLYDGKTSSLLWEVGRVLNELKEEGRLPKYLLMENVPTIMGKANNEGFSAWKDQLKEMGYHNWAFKLKSSYFGIPQNRERAFLVSILNGNSEDFTVPVQTKLTPLRIKDIMVESVDEERFYAKDILKYFPTNLNVSHSVNGLRRFMLTKQGGFDTEKRIYHLDSIAPTIMGGSTRVKILLPSGRVRFLVARECWRLMGFKDEQFDKVDGVFDNNELIKMAGNSIVVNVLESVFKNILKI